MNRDPRTRQVADAATASRAPENTPTMVKDVYKRQAYIDPENEALVQQAISTLTVGKTLIVIAHRLSTIVGADNIVVVKDGTIHAPVSYTHLDVYKRQAIHSQVLRSLCRRI